MTIHQARHTYDPNRPFFPWLLTLSRRRIANGVRCRSRTKRREMVIDAFDVTFIDNPANIECESSVDSERLCSVIGATR
ncbi:MULTISPECIES: hypothetical protein [Pseudomonas]|jgi:RNA polymerase sigma-70 factor (ECF subfamily)|uniref:hypothetical protein n=1 Tax=Pseudomonas TaxID=286 RepID=UPI00093CC63A|nr:MULTISPECIES: hypothetical protein [Pseudomonas]OKP67348.1 hypothetical protein BTR19_23945 [Pseudomonas fluorescens]MCF5511390.1 hypothetical protein [Pseudomonas sp. PA-3-6H]MCF5518028.1 hypothetical protein [Pseudomonas sp. PA-3-6E]MCF5565001.1 hypothetical protein [Pseudomonas sp. PA-3-5D]MCF5570972.1 hypothetical protein [Pseudomonas sp. PA-3-11C]